MLAPHILKLAEGAAQAAAATKDPWWADAIRLAVVVRATLPTLPHAPSLLVDPASRARAQAIALYMSVTIRLYAVTNYGRVIHEFDPWFNYRATEYMVANGWDKFQARRPLRTHAPRAHTPTASDDSIIVSFVVATTNSSDDYPLSGSPPID